MELKDLGKIAPKKLLYKWIIDLADEFAKELKRQANSEGAAKSDKSIINNKIYIIDTLIELAKITNDRDELSILSSSHLKKIALFHDSVTHNQSDTSYPLSFTSISYEQLDKALLKTVELLYGALLEFYLKASAITTSTIDIDYLLNRLFSTEKAASSAGMFEQSIYAAKLELYQVVQSRFSSLDELYNEKTSEFKSLAIRVDNQISETKSNMDSAISETQEKMTKLADKMSQLEALRDKIDNLTTEYNFVGLSSGFERIWRKKKDENNVIIAILFIMAIAMAIIPIYLYSISDNQDADISIINHIIHITPLFTVEIILLYFFRVLLHQLNNVKAVLLQVEQRLNICQFFSSYVDYAEQHKADKERFEKFESLIFSGLLMDQSQLPSTFDGLDNLSKLIGSMKGKP
ncbi:hypothetical protein LH435_13650 [Laribacter hongkongensis]|uniref:hypothetical protein n=1 Tax=Laribacter hongkongensis TaxID=168471 RepID=UPI001EFD1C60|nr:hypothetical protein [Laribacter hongkongensis]MCG8995588.1 hypothetical protein [Laribacter hongkongensis]MCG9009320.1 hypothetical protein [Laribacter hongkongensis]MCG9022653.1 hypothetical protein [Laribacter hongkongensis]MCG9045606.1 hypothetical protein [Laribacter hongkongensis]MCG9075032.1 hypothetical protein [Laribacter hongkongensis]